MEKKKIRKKKSKEMSTQTREENINKYNNNKISIDVQLQKLKENIKINYIFYIVTLFCLYALSWSKASDKSFIFIVLTFIIVSTLGYFYHYITHHIQFSEVYKEHDTIIRKCPIVDKFVLKLCNIVDFHHVVHHDTSYEKEDDIVPVNKKWKNIIYEFCHNFISQGLGIILLSKFLNYLDTSTILLWTTAYATIHNINYNIIKPTCHIDHHKDDKTNYGIDIYDIIFGTKYNWDDLENYNHYSINMIIITISIILLSNILYKKK